MYYSYVICIYTNNILQQSQANPLKNITMGLTSNQEMFLGISFIIIIIIMLLVKDKVQAMLIVGLIANFLLISTQLVIISDRRTQDKYSQLDFENTKSSIKSTFVSRHTQPAELRGKIITQKDIAKLEGTQESPKKFIDYQGGISDTAANGFTVSNPADDILPAGTIDDDFYFSSPTGNALLARDTMLRGHSSRVNPRNNNRSLIEKYILPELEEEEVKPWWGRD